MPPMGRKSGRDAYAAQASNRGGRGDTLVPEVSPTVTDGKVITLGVRGTLSPALMPPRRARFSGGKMKSPAGPSTSPACHPLWVDGLVIAHVGGPTNGTIVACDLATGREKWQWNR